MSSNVMEALYVRNTFAVSPGIRSFRCAFSLVVSSLSKRSYPGGFPTRPEVLGQRYRRFKTNEMEENNNSEIPRRKPSIALYTSSSTSTVLKYLIESLPRKSNCKVNAKSYIQTASELRSHIVILSKHAEY